MNNEVMEVLMRKLSSIEDRIESIERRFIDFSNQLEDFEKNIEDAKSKDDRTVEWLARGKSIMEEFSKNYKAFKEAKEKAGVKDIVKETNKVIEEAVVEWLESKNRKLSDS